MHLGRHELTHSERSRIRFENNYLPLWAAFKKLLPRVIKSPESPAAMDVFLGTISVPSEELVMALSSTFGPTESFVGLYDGTEFRWNSSAQVRQIDGTPDAIRVYEHTVETCKNTGHGFGTMMISFASMLCECMVKQLPEDREAYSLIFADPRSWSGAIAYSLGYSYEPVPNNFGIYQGHRVWLKNWND